MQVSSSLKPRPSTHLPHCLFLPCHSLLLTQTRGWQHLPLLGRHSLAVHECTRWVTSVGGAHHTGAWPITCGHLGSVSVPNKTTCLHTHKNTQILIQLHKREVNWRSEKHETQDTLWAQGCAEVTQFSCTVSWRMRNKQATRTQQQLRPLRGWRERLKSLCTKKGNLSRIKFKKGIIDNEPTNY